MTRALEGLQFYCRVIFVGRSPIDFQLFTRFVTVLILNLDLESHKWFNLLSMILHSLVCFTNDQEWFLTHYFTFSDSKKRELPYNQQSAYNSSSLKQLTKCWFKLCLFLLLNYFTEWLVFSLISFVWREFGVCEIAFKLWYLLCYFTNTVFKVVWWYGFTCDHNLSFNSLFALVNW